MVTWPLHIPPGDEEEMIGGCCDPNQGFCCLFKEMGGRGGGSEKRRGDQNWGRMGLELKISSLSISMSIEVK